MEKSELFSLEALGIVSLNLEALERSDLDTSLEENQVVGRSVFERSDGTQGVLGDVAFFVTERGNMDSAPVLFNADNHLPIQEYLVI